VAKKRIVIDYEKLPLETINSIKTEYPDGYEDNLITFTNKEGKYVSALPFETEDIYYLVRMTEHEARQIIKEDDDYNNDGKLRDDFSDDLKDVDEDEDEDKEEYLNDNFDEASNIKDEGYDED
jgi:DNA-directed RNA polymerase subunit delta